MLFYKKYFKVKNFLITLLKKINTPEKLKNCYRGLQANSFWVIHLQVEIPLFQYEYRFVMDRWNDYRI